MYKKISMHNFLVPVEGWWPSATSWWGHQPFFLLSLHTMHTFSHLGVLESLDITSGQSTKINCVTLFCNCISKTTC